MEVGENRKNEIRRKHREKGEEGREEERKKEE